MAAGKIYDAGRVRKKKRKGWTEKAFSWVAWLYGKGREELGI